jgi:hypothetical protein
MHASGHTTVWGTSISVCRASDATRWYQQLNAWGVAHHAARHDAQLATHRARWDARREAVRPCLLTPPRHGCLRTRLLDHHGALQPERLMTQAAPSAPQHASPNDPHGCGPANSRPSAAVLCGVACPSLARRSCVRLPAEPVGRPDRTMCSSRRVSSGRRSRLGCHTRAVAS